MEHIKIFDDTRINTGRQYELDWARGLAILFIVFVHVKIELSGLPLSHTYSKIVEFFGSPAAAPTFMILLGAGIVYAKNSTHQKLAMRGLKLIALHYILNVFAFGVPLLIRFFQTKDNTVLSESINYTFGIDILASAGITFLFFALVKKLKLRFIKGVALLGFNTPPLGALHTGGCGGFVPPHTQRFQGEIFDTAGLALRFFIHIVLITLALSCLNYLLTVPADNVILGSTAGLFVRVWEYSYFPFFAWIGYPVMGYDFGNLLVRCADKNSFYKYLFPWGKYPVPRAKLDP